MTPPALMGRSAPPSPLPTPRDPPRDIVARIERSRITAARGEKARTQRGAALRLLQLVRAREEQRPTRARSWQRERCDVQTRERTGGRTHVPGSHGRGVGWTRRRRTQASKGNRALEAPLAGDARHLGHSASKESVSKVEGRSVQSIPLSLSPSSPSESAVARPSVVS